MSGLSTTIHITILLVAAITEEKLNLLLTNNGDAYGPGCMCNI